MHTDETTVEELGPNQRVLSNYPQEMWVFPYESVSISVHPWFQLNHSGQLEQIDL